MLGGHPGASMLDDLLAHGRPSCIGTTFLDLDDTMDELEIVQFLVHHQSPFLFILVHSGPIQSMQSISV